MIHNVDLQRLLQEVATEIQRQQVKNMDLHDYNHKPLDWHEMIADYNSWARRMYTMGSLEKAKTKYIQVAALAIAAANQINEAPAITDIVLNHFDCKYGNN
jgi:hypothetical protein